MMDLYFFLFLEAEELDEENDDEYSAKSSGKDEFDSDFDEDSDVENNDQDGNDTDGENDEKRKKIMKMAQNSKAFIEKQRTRPGKSKPFYGNQQNKNIQNNKKNSEVKAISKQQSKDSVVVVPDDDERKEIFIEDGDENNSDVIIERVSKNKRSTLRESTRMIRGEDIIMKKLKKHEENVKTDSKKEVKSKFIHDIYSQEELLREAPLTELANKRKLVKNHINIYL
jgi:hypothetical protein